MSETPKQKKARLTFEHFRDLCGDVPHSSFEIWEDTKKDPPDICVGDYKLALELTDYYRDRGERGSRLKQREERYACVMAQAQEKFEEKISAPIAVTCSWSSHFPKKTLKSKLAVALAEIIVHRLPLEPWDSISIEWDDYSDTCLAPYLNSVHVQRLPVTLASGKAATSNWETNSAGWLRNLELTELERITRKKENLMRERDYKAQFCAAWLVIVAYGDMSSTVEWNDSLTPGCLISEFDRVYFYDVFSKRVFLLTDNES